MICDPALPPQTLPLCDNGHVACVQAWEPGETEAWCWGYHLIYRNDNWRAVVGHPGAVSEAIERLVFMLVEHEVDISRCTFAGRGL